MSRPGAAEVVEVVLEVGKRRTFASALDWPGWARSGRGEEEAIEALLGYAGRYAPVVLRAGLTLPKRTAAVVVERCAGDATTDFGAPGIAAAAESEPMTASEAARRATLVAAAWDCLGDVAAKAPASLRKGPRGGGRDRDAVVAHVVNAEAAYARKLGIDTRAQQVRPALLEVLGRAREGTPMKDNGWTARYGARRIAWHVLDHAWEIEDRSV